jgi:protocatechuate 3,4-dioxygenase beta subunit
MSAFTRLLPLWVFFCLPPLAAQVVVNVAGSDGKPVKNALVIVQDLNHQERESYRVLTNADGNTPSHDLPPGVYRAIATYPYSRWRPQVREFVVANQPITVQLTLAEASGLDTLDVAIGQLSVHVVDAGGKPVRGARVLVRDANATPHSEHWGTTDANGQTSLELTLEPSVLVVVYQNRVYTFPANAFDTERTVQLK